MKSITINIRPDGKVEFDTTGFKGKGCKDITAEMEKELGVVVDTKKKPEFNQASTLKQTT